MNPRLKEMMEQRLQALGVQPPPPVSKGIFKKPFSDVSFRVQAAEGFSEHFLEFRFKDGNRVAFAYAELTYINFDCGESRLDLNFRGYIVSLHGKNFTGEFLDSLMDCKVRWVAETATPERNDQHAATFYRIEITPPASADAEEVNAVETAELSEFRLEEEQ